MSVSLIANISKYIGVSTDAKPTGVPVGSEFFETNTRLTYICHDGTNWAQKITSPSGPTAMDAKTDPAANAATTTTIIDAYGGTVITTTAAGNSQTIGDPTITTAGKLFTVANNDTSTHSVPIVANGVTFTVTPGEAQTFIWDGSAWGPIDIGITAIPVIVSQGGTGLATITDHSVMVGSGTGAVTPISVGASGEILAGVTGADPAFTATPSGLTSIGVTTVNATTVNATTFDTNVAAAGVTLSGTTLAADGTDADIDINITPKGTGEVNISKADIDAGTIDGAVLGVTKTNIQKGPPIVTTFAGTVTAAASTTVTFSSAADAILAGYHATNPILGTTLISNALTRYIVSWTNATTCVVDKSVTWAGTAITSVQFPIATFVDYNGVTAGWINAARNLYVIEPLYVSSRVTDNIYGGTYIEFDNDIKLTANRNVLLGSGVGNILLGSLTAAGATAANVLAMGEGTAATAVITNGIQAWSADRDGVAGDNRLHIMGEKTTATVIIGDGQVEFNAPANGKGTGIVVYRQAGENLVYKDSCYIKTDGKMWKTDADSYTTMPTTRIALETINADAWGLFLEYGYMRDDTWTWTAGGTIYADTTTGAWTQTAVSGQSDVLQIIGVAESATVAKINPSWVTTEIGLDVVTVSSADAAITVSSLTSVPVQYHVTTGNSDRTLTIDAMSAADIGKGIEIYKVDPGGSGKVIVTAPAGVYFVNSAGASTAGGTITSEASKYQMVSLRFISATLIQIKYADGTWTKSS